MAAPVLNKNAAPIRTCGVTWPVTASSPSPAATTNTQIWENSRYLRRSTISAITPDGRANRNMGRLLAACTIATINGSELRVNIIQLVPTSLIHEPILEATVAIHNMRNTSWRSGLHGDDASPAGDVGCATP